MTEPKFEPGSIDRFVFAGFDFDAATGIARLRYRFEPGPEFIETLSFPGAPFGALAEADRERFDRALQLLHLLAGISYYKAAVPPAVVVEGPQPSAAVARFVEQVYRQGLGEFSYRAGISVADFELPAQGLGPVSSSTGESGANAPPRRVLTAIGGGKDSLVSIDWLARLGVEQQVAFVGGSSLIATCAAATGLPVVRVGRQLSPALFELNRRGAYNGHIPVTAINSAILVCAAILLDMDGVIFSNERSASFGSLIPGTGEVNHQWSKSWAFESAFSQIIGAGEPGGLDLDVAYLSLLRPWSELAIAARFAKLSGFDQVFSSCNRNFHILGERPAERWCGHCPKCLFVFLALAPFMPKPRLVAVFGRNLLDDPKLAGGYDALLEWGDHKPFECVGEGVESRAAMYALSQRPSWSEDAIVERFVTTILPTLEAEDLSLESQLRPAGPHAVPEAWLRDEPAAG